MALQSYFCHQCHKKSPTHQKLFDTLYEFHKSRPEDCPNCGGSRELHLNLDFQLGSGDGDFQVVSAFLPDKLDSWLGAEEEEVTLYPFMVVLQRIGDNRQFVWTPYWHVTGNDARYGQHALCLDQAQFESLTSQARSKIEREAVLEIV